MAIAICPKCRKTNVTYVIEDRVGQDTHQHWKCNECDKIFLIII